MLALAADQVWCRAGAGSTALPADGPARLGVLDLHPASPRRRPTHGPAHLPEPARQANDGDGRAGRHRVIGPFRPRVVVAARVPGDRMPQTPDAPAVAPGWPAPSSPQIP